MDINPMQAMVDAFSRGMEEQRAGSQMTLGALIAELETFDPKRLVQGFGKPHSYRGYYEDLAFEPSEETMEVRLLLDVCRGCMGQVFEGY